MKGALPAIEAFKPELIGWRRRIHAYPETAYEEYRTAEFVANLLIEFGLDVERGIAGTGVVGTLRVGNGARTIALRADMDALNMQELSDCAYRSQRDGKMHACGHDGHTAMLLGAAKYLACTRRFDGTVHFLFQPAEEGGGGAKRMLDEGLFRRFPADCAFAIHNLPGMPLGMLGISGGPQLAAFDLFDLAVRGSGTHAALPHRGVDSILVATAIVQGWQSIVARALDPLAGAVVSVTQFHGGDAYNVIPGTVVLKGGVRWFEPAVQEKIHSRMRAIAEGIAAAHGAEVTLDIEHRYPPTVNDPQQAAFALQVADDLVGPAQVERSPKPLMGSEDFAFILQQRPGAYIWLGAGRVSDGASLHGPHYDFNDALLSLGASYWSRLAETYLQA